MKIETTNRPCLSKFHHIVEAFPKVAIRELMENIYSNVVSVEVLWPCQINTSAVVLPSFYKYQGDFRAVCVFKATLDSGAIMYSAHYVIDYGKGLYSYDLISNGWTETLSVCIESALAYFYSIGEYADTYGTKFWNDKGESLKFENNTENIEYKVGDKVTIKSYKWYRKLSDSYGNIEIEGKDGDFSELMSKYCGRTMTITRQLCHNQYELDGIDFWFPDWCFERIDSTAYKAKSEVVPRSIHNRKERTQKTYLMRDENTGCTKIGKSVNPRTRERTLLSDKPTITLFMVCERNVERVLHKEYAEKNVRGEWFNLTAEDIADISKKYNFYSVNN